MIGKGRRKQGKQEVFQLEIQRELSRGSVRGRGRRKQGKQGDPIRNQRGPTIGNTKEKAR